MGIPTAIPWSGPRQLDVHLDCHCLQSRPVAEAGAGRGVAMSEICPDSAKPTKIDVATGTRSEISYNLRESYTIAIRPSLLQH